MSNEEITTLVLTIIGVLDIILNLLNRHRLKKIKKDIETKTETTEDTIIENAMAEYLKNKEK